MVPAFLFALQVAASSGEGAGVSGTIASSANGRPILGSTITAVEAKKTGFSDRDGHYTIFGLSAGSHTLSVRALGHLPYSLRVILPASGVLDVSVVLQEVPARLTPVLILKSPVGPPRRPLDGRQLVDLDPAHDSPLAEHPLLAEPNVLRALAGGAVTVAAEAPGGLHVKGGSSDQTSFTVDGAPYFNPYHVSDLMGAINTDALGGARLDATHSDAAALSGTLATFTRTPSAHFGMRGAVSTSHARFTVDAPIAGGSTLMLAGRSAFPAPFAPATDPVFVRGTSRDGVAKLTSRLRGGTLTALWMQNADQFGVATVPIDDPIGFRERNAFQWGSSLGSLQWRGAPHGDSLVAMAWRSTTEVEGVWATALVASNRADIGAQVSLAHDQGGDSWRLGARLERPHLQYEASDSSAQLTYASRTPLATVFASGERAIQATLGLGVNGSVILYEGRLYAAPGVYVRWAPRTNLQVVALVSRAQQFAQSVRNPESVVGNVFPADLFVGAQRGVLPVAHSREGSLSVAWDPSASLSFGLLGYRRRLTGVAMIAATEAGPFARRGVPVGTSEVTGGSANLSIAQPRWQAVARVGAQDVRHEYGLRRFRPSFGARMNAEGGVTYTAAARTVLRVGVSWQGARRVTPAYGVLEWESCNLRDRGCEFAGTPTIDPSRVGSLRAPAYARVDLGFRRTLSLSLGGRSGEIGLFGTYSNLLGHYNVLTYLITDGLRSPIEMRPASPLVVGLDWRF